MKLKAVIFGAITVVTAGLVFLTTRAKAATPDKPPAPPPPPPGPGPKPGPVTPTGDCPTGIMPGVSMSLSTAQGALNSAGANPLLGVDGKYGPASRNAIAEFQYANGLPQTGCVDQKTATALQPFAKAQGPYSSKYKDQNGMFWQITKPGISIWRAQQIPIDTSGAGDWQLPYPYQSEIFDAVTYDLLINRIETQVAGGYES